MGFLYIYFKYVKCIQTLSIEVGSVSEKYYIQESVDMEMGGRISSVEGLLHTLLEFCQRNSTTVEESERQASYCVESSRSSNYCKFATSNIQDSVWVSDHLIGPCKALNIEAHHTEEYCLSGYLEVMFSIIIQ